MYDEKAGDKVDDIEKSDLKINLNPCLPVETNSRKTSSNSQNLHQNNPLQDYENVDSSKGNVRDSKLPSRFKSHTNCKVYKAEIASD